MITEKTIVFIVPPRVHLLDLTGAAHIFYEAADMGAPLRLVFASPDEGEMVQSTAGLVLGRLGHFSNYTLQPGDYVFVPGLESDLLLSESFYGERSAFFEWLREAYEGGANVASVCTGAFLLAASGILDGKLCTTHWKFYRTIREMFPAIDLKENRLFTDAGRLLTSAGVASGIDLALYVLEKEYGTTLAGRVAREVVVYHRRGEGDPQLSVYLQYRNHLNGRVHRVQEHLSAHLAEKCTLSDLAEVVGTSSRNLTRLFRETTGITIGLYHEKLRAEEALRLERLGHTRDFIAEACGLSSTNQVRHLLNKYREAMA
ncbi:GlxA family transcriptional regulator [Roseivirga sp. BDSF3-8]|uniref:GlxA family transcriptional regulator n=1 Tax=Roseivirga sp. BDSF3-8 TaxID=3241598 RepID=UPI003531A113